MKRPILMVFALIAFTGSVLAQAATNAIPAAPGLGLPNTKMEFWIWSIAVLTPLIMTCVRQVMPKIPKLLIPIATPFIGIVLGLLLNWLQKSNLSWVDMAQAGALAVFIREIVDQASRTALVQSALGTTYVLPAAPTPATPATPATPPAVVTSTGTL